MYALTVIGELVVLASVKPIAVVCVDAPAVTRTTGVVPTFLATYRVKVFAIWVPYPNAIAIATAVPAGSFNATIDEPAAFLKYATPLPMFSASSPSTKLPVVGKDAELVV
jgi:hypothetical protein